MTFVPTFGTSKAGGDVTQANVGSQGNVSTQALHGASSAGPAILDAAGGASALEQLAAQGIAQQFGQANLGVAGSGGNDNAQSNTDIGV